MQCHEARGQQLQGGDAEVIITVNFDYDFTVGLLSILEDYEKGDSDEGKKLPISLNKRIRRLYWVMDKEKQISL